MAAKILFFIFTSRKDITLMQHIFVVNLKFINFNCLHRNMLDQQ